MTMDRRTLLKSIAVASLCASAAPLCASAAPLSETAAAPAPIDFTRGGGTVVKYSPSDYPAMFNMPRDEAYYVMHPDQPEPFDITNLGGKYLPDDQVISLKEWTKREAVRLAREKGTIS